MDEPTATLSDKEITNLFETIKILKKKGVSIIYISHRLQEIRQVGDRVTVLRDGVTVGTRDVREIAVDEMIQMMVGRKISQHRVRLHNTGLEEKAFEIRNLSQGVLLKNISLHVRKGEIVALAGLVGAGRTELVHAAFGVDRYESGEVMLFGNDITGTSPKKAIGSGMGLLPESRKENGLSLIQAVRENLTHAGLSKISTFGFLSLKKEKLIAEQYIQQLKIACPGMNQKVKFLSGGNQQKVVLGKWLYTGCQFLIFDEPTRGIDVGTRSEIYNLMNSLATQGTGILMVSSDLLEIMTIADRIYVMREGAVVKELDAYSTTQEEIISYAAGSGAT
jgi:ribose transport system ATP-binding protein